MQFDNEEFYHVYNRSFNKTKIFYTEENYSYFLRKLNTIKSICDIVAYCLMPDHFHLLIYIPRESEATLQTAQSGQTGIQLISRKIGTILSSYAQGINKQEKRAGSLFQPKTKAKQLDKENYPFNCFHYIHQNPHKAGLVNRIEDWRFSSFREYY
jgi:putative transposase